MYFHIRVTLHSDRSHDVIKLDMSEAQLQERVITAYREGRPFLLSGKTIDPTDIDTISITKTTQNSLMLLPDIRAERAQSSVRCSISDEWYVANSGQDVTDDLITEPPGRMTPTPANSYTSSADPTIVFVVHGRDEKARDSIFLFLRSIGLHPLEWSEAVAATGVPSPYVGQILEAAFSRACAVLVLMTPDDEARLRTSFQSASDPPYERSLFGQARANVLFEAGMAFGRAADRTVLVELGTLRPFSDIGGRHTLRLNNSTSRRQELAMRLHASGCEVNLQGTQWHTTGDFDYE